MCVGSKTSFMVTPPICSRSVTDGTEHSFPQIGEIMEDWKDDLAKVIQKKCEEDRITQMVIEYKDGRVSFDFTNPLDSEELEKQFKDSKMYKLFEIGEA